MIKLVKQLENVKRPELYDYEVLDFSKEQKKKLDRLNISSLMITGKLLSISPEVYYRLEKTEEPFLITGEFIKAGLLFKFSNGKIKLKEVLESKNIFERN